MPLTMTPLPLNDEIEILRVEIMSLKERIEATNRLLHTGNLTGEAAIQVYEAMMEQVFQLFVKRERLIKEVLDNSSGSNTP